MVHVTPMSDIMGMCQKWGASRRGFWVESRGVSRHRTPNGKGRGSDALADLGGVLGSRRQTTSTWHEPDEYPYGSEFEQGTLWRTSFGWGFMSRSLLRQFPVKIHGHRKKAARASEARAELELLSLSQPREVEKARTRRWGLDPTWPKVMLRSSAVSLSEPPLCFCGKICEAIKNT